MIFMSVFNNLEILLKNYFSFPDDKNEKTKKMNENYVTKFSQILNSNEIQEFIEEFIDSYQGQFLDDSIVIKLQFIIKAAQIVYNYSGIDTGISDFVYDKIYEALEKTNTLMDEYMSVPNLSDKMYYHTYKSLRGTLDKIYFLKENDSENVANKSRKGLNDWVKSSARKIKEKTGEDIDLWNEDIYVFPKWDGVSIIFKFDKNGKLKEALTRGYTVTNEAQNVTHIFDGWVEGPFKDMDRDYGLKTEVMMTEDDLQIYNKKYKTDYKNSRSIVSSIINSDEVDDRVLFLQIISLRTSTILDNGEESNQSLAPAAFNKPFIRCKLSDIEKIEEFAINHRYVDGLRCDGAVIYIINEKIQNILGRENEKQKYEVAYKFTEETGYSKIETVKFTTGLFGTINPVAVFKPIKLKGNTVGHASIGSIDRFHELNLAKGDTVKVLYDIIPYCQYDENDPNCKRSGEPPIKEPTHCVECGSLLEKNGNSGLHCVNPKCPCRKKGKILNFINKMNIDGISYATIDTLYEEGYLKKIEDLYKLKTHKKKISKLDGFGEKKVKNILRSIESIRSITESDFLGAIGIPSISKRIFKNILHYISYDELLEVCIYDNNMVKAVNLLTVIPGIGNINATKIYEGLRENKDLIEYLEKELEITKEPSSSPCIFKVCFTKIRDNELEKWIEEKGGTVSDNVTKDTDILIIPLRGVTSSSVKKAEKYGIDIVPIKEFKDWVTRKYRL